MTDLAVAAKLLDGLDARRVLVGGVPRILLNGLGPPMAFLAGRALGGLVGGIAAAASLSLGLFLWERRKSRPGLLAWISLGELTLSVVIGIVFHSAALFFLPAVLMDLVQGLSCYASCATRRPLGRVLASEMVVLPDAVYELPRVRRLTLWLTVVWGTYFTARAVVCLWALALWHTDGFLAVRVAVDAPVVLPLLAGSIVVMVRRLREIVGEEVGARAVPTATGVAG
ncbi:hypothetical protein Val02_56870 [Virgisporangium aliadipatigenens]|uniref:DUF3159 domain-containing protein n=1 Tax=Virgisporangium aliadipatigenens TaxID=741659 RepID=A0A8J3YS31_9ACTN|nr:DUF3159 domain-containing protein [Virgisporangium aliadipatigenens]GIJ48801.1 hypothetical protein Val02_56870 [Virgisporangium aliadipatigenens]